MDISIGNLIIISIGAIFIQNFVLAKFLGICPFIGVSKKLNSALGMGMAVIFVLTIASAVTWLIYHYLLLESGIFNKDLTYLRTITFILVIATLVQLVEMLIRKNSPSLYKALGIYLPLITTNCAVLGATILAINKKLGFLETVIHGAASGVGFTIAIILMAGIRERLEVAKVPKAFKEVPITFIAAALLAMAFLGFSGMKF
jgi:electron transport complex protein RnfA